MSKTIGNELYCRSCEYEVRTEHREFECPKCGSGDVCNNSFITCDCGTTVYLDRFTNQCDGCGKLYNNFGRSCSARRMDPDDRIEAIGL